MITTKVKWKAVFVSLFFLCLYLVLLYIVIFIAVYITYTYPADDDDADSKQELAEKGYTLPECAFVVECGGERRRVSEIERERASRAVAEQQAKASSQAVDSTSSSSQGFIGD